MWRQGPHCGPPELSQLVHRRVPQVLLVQPGGHREGTERGEGGV
ncbi:hypothetical protein LEMLEM_LOCUS14752 [Lemmus lemmus]